MRDVRQHFESKLIVGHEGGHWSLDVHRDAKGYSRIAVGGGVVERGHVVAHKLYIGDIPKGYVVDHLCVTEWCCNPAHLEAVTNSENLRRSYSFCNRGHDLTKPENYYLRRNGNRLCKPCNNLRNAKRGCPGFTRG